jgi:hypothetical protein
MVEVSKIMWPGFSGKTYEYWIYPVGTSFREESGNYIFAKETKPGSWSPCYIGQTKNLDHHLSDHEKETCSKRNGATHIHAPLTSGSEAYTTFDRGRHGRCT